MPILNNHFPHTYTQTKANTQNWYIVEGIIQYGVCFDHLIHTNLRLFSTFARFHFTADDNYLIYDKTACLSPTHNDPNDEIWTALIPVTYNLLPRQCMEFVSSRLISTPIVTSKGLLSIEPANGEVIAIYSKPLLLPEPMLTNIKGWRMANYLLTYVVNNLPIV